MELDPTPRDVERPLAVRSVERSLASRYTAYIDEVQRLIHAGVVVMDRERTTNPKVSEIVREAGLSNQAFYKHFRGKSELLLAILDDGQRQLVTYLRHQMAKDRTGVGKVRTWIDGMLSQAVVPAAATATRGVVLNSFELRERYPEEFRRHFGMLVEPLVDAIELAGQQGDVSIEEPRRAASAIFRLVVSWMENCLMSHEIPGRAEIEYLQSFSLRALGLAEEHT